MTHLKKIILFVLIALTSCDDGDFKSLDFQFTETINSCGTYVLYKTNNTKTETLIVTLSDNELGTTEGEKTYSIGGEINVVYRLFNKAVGADYFCKNIPPTTPTIIRNLNADPKTSVSITTTKKDSQYEYKIVLTNLLFEDDDRFYFDTFNFGTFIK